MSAISIKNPEESGLIKKNSNENLHDLYLSSKLYRQKLYVTLELCTFAISLVAIKIISTLAISFSALSIIGIVLCALNIGMGIYYLKILHKDNHQEKSIQDLFKTRGQQIVFQTKGFLGLSGFETKVFSF